MDSEPRPFYSLLEREKIDWQKEAMYMCECENFLNSRIEAGLARIPSNNDRVQASAIDSAIVVCGLRIPFRTSCVYSFLNSAPPPARRARLEQLSLRAFRSSNDSDEDNIAETFFEEAIAAAINQRGLDMPPNT